MLSARWVLITRERKKTLEFQEIPYCSFIPLDTIRCIYPGESIAPAGGGKLGNNQRTIYKISLEAPSEYARWKAMEGNCSMYISCSNIFYTSGFKSKGTIRIMLIIYSVGDESRGVSILISWETMQNPRLVVLGVRTKSS